MAHSKSSLMKTWKSNNVKMLLKKPLQNFAVGCEKKWTYEWEWGWGGKNIKEEREEKTGLNWEMIPRWKDQACVNMDYHVLLTWYFFDQLYKIKFGSCGKFVLKINILIYKVVQLSITIFKWLFIYSSSKVVYG
jgi:hypothetical protein